MSITMPEPHRRRAGEPLKRLLIAAAPNRVWVLNCASGCMWAGFVYVAFVQGMFAQRIKGWHASSSIYKEATPKVRTHEVATGNPGRFKTPTLTTRTELSLFYDHRAKPKVFHPQTALSSFPSLPPSMPALPHGITVTHNEPRANATRSPSTP